MKKIIGFGLISLLGVFLVIGLEKQFSHAQLVSPTARAVVVPFSVERDNIAASSVNLDFGFTAKTVAIEAGTTNTAVIAIDWVGGTAVCPAINTAGDARFPVGRIIMKDDANIRSISVIACSGTQSVNVTAWQ